MRRKYKLAVAFSFLCLGGALLAAILYLRRAGVAVLDPAGPIAAKQRGLILFSLLLSLIVVIPVYIMAAAFAWRYRAGNPKAKYSPDLDHNLAAETTWWLIPAVLIFILSVITFRSSHQLDPFKPLSSGADPITIEVVALQWKWLFIYPRQSIATVNFVQFPAYTPLDFQITADAPMNSFWIPRLGGQIYAMSGMSTELHLEASRTGDFRGSSANISGEGFAGMNFLARASSTADFNSWVNSIKKSSGSLDMSEYVKLVKPSKYNQPAYYADVQSGLYETVVSKYAPFQNHIHVGVSS